MYEYIYGIEIAGVYLKLLKLNIYKLCNFLFLENEVTINPHYKINNNMKHIGTTSFTDMLYEELNGKLPGSASYKRSPSRKLLRTPANERARENFEYWYKEAKPIKHGEKPISYTRPK